MVPNKKLTIKRLTLKKFTIKKVAIEEVGVTIGTTIKNIRGYDIHSLMKKRSKRNSKKHIKSPSVRPKKKQISTQTFFLFLILFPFPFPFSLLPSLPPLTIRTTKAYPKKKKDINISPISLQKKSPLFNFLSRTLPWLFRKSPGPIISTLGADPGVRNFLLLPTPRSRCLSFPKHIAHHVQTIHC